MRTTFLPFALPDTDDNEIEEVAEAIRSGWVTTGPKVRQFETDFGAVVGAAHALAVNSCTAAMHLALEAIGLQAGDLVLTTPYTFAATAEVIRYFQATPVFVDVEPETLNLNPELLAEAVAGLTAGRTAQIADRWLPPALRNGQQRSIVNLKHLHVAQAQVSKSCPERSRRVQNLKSIIPVHLGGLPADLDAIYQIARRHNLAVIEDAAHAFPAKYKGRMIGSSPESPAATSQPSALNPHNSALSTHHSKLTTQNSPLKTHHSKLTTQNSSLKTQNSSLKTQNSSLITPSAVCFSFYATKTITTGEGGMLCTDDEAIAERSRIMALHGISQDAWKRYSAEGSWYYEIVEPGYKYNMTDVAAAMGLAQLAKAERMWRRRQAIAHRYQRAFGDRPELQIPADRADCQHAWHLYLLRLRPERLDISRNQFIEALRARHIGTSVHFIPLHLHPYYRQTYGYQPQDFRVAHREYQRVISLPIYSKMSDQDVQDVIEAVLAVVDRHRLRRLSVAGRA